MRGTADVAKAADPWVSEKVGLEVAASLALLTVGVGVAVNARAAAKVGRAVEDLRSFDREIAPTISRLTNRPDIEIARLPNLTVESIPPGTSKMHLVDPHQFSHCMTGKVRAELDADGLARLIVNSAFPEQFSFVSLNGTVGRIPRSGVQTVDTRQGTSALFGQDWRGRRERKPMFLFRDGTAFKIDSWL